MRWLCKYNYNIIVVPGLQNFFSYKIVNVVYPAGLDATGGGPGKTHCACNTAIRVAKVESDRERMGDGSWKIAPRQMQLHFFFEKKSSCRSMISEVRYYIRSILCPYSHVYQTPLPFGYWHLLAVTSMPLDMSNCLAYLHRVLRATWYARAADIHRDVALVHGLVCVATTIQVVAVTSIQSNSLVGVTCRSCILLAFFLAGVLGMHSWRLVSCSEQFSIKRYE